MSRRIFFALHAAMAVTAALMSVGCAKKRPAPRVVYAPRGWSETGIASWYGDPYHGRRAADGSVYDMEKMTAAHRTLAFGTKVRVERMDTRAKTEVRITDRGPFVEGRIIDLSRAAARKIDLLGPGTAKVRITVTEAASEAARGTYSVQAGLYQEKDRAEARRRELRGLREEPRVEEREGGARGWRVLVGRFDTEEAARKMAEKIGKGAFVVRVGER